MIIQNRNIKGIHIKDAEIKISQFADDTTLVLDGTRESLLAALNTLEIYGTASGLKINTDKTQIVWIGKKKLSTDKFETSKPLVWGNSEFNLLGIKFSVNLECMVDLNFKPLIDDVKLTLAKWRKRFLTPLGKITIIKTLVLPKFNHLFISLPTPNERTINSINSAFFKFIWDDKPDKISRKQLTKKHLHGGLKMVDLHKFISSLKINLVTKAG